MHWAPEFAVLGIRCPGIPTLDMAGSQGYGQPLFLRYTPPNTTHVATDLVATTIALLNMKGGVGKTTLAVNLAWHSYRHKKRRVLLIDLDPQFNASQYLMDFEQYKTHLKEKGSIADLLIDQPALGLGKKTKSVIPVANRIARMEVSKSGHYLDFLPSQLALAHVVKNPAQMDFRLEKILEQIRSHYDYIFIDCAPTDSVLTTMALTASNFILIPIRPDRFSILGYANLVDTIKSFKEKTPDPNKVAELALSLHR